MIELKSWLDQFLNALRAPFGDRVYFVGLQGSHARGEATDGSDIDVVVILDKLTSADIRLYRAMLDTLPHRELVCGFLSGKNELLNWEPSDLFQFYHDTTPIQGSLDDLLPLLDAAAVDRAIKIGACNIYHGCVHNMLHDKSEEILQGLYKSASFVVQAIAYRETGTYIRHREELLRRVSEDENKILQIATSLKTGGEVNFEAMSEILFAWAQKHIGIAP